MTPSENSIGWIIGPSYILSDIVYQQVVAVVQERLSHRIIRVDARERSITLRNLGGGISTIRGRSADTPSNLLGAALDWAIIDEAALLGNNVWDGYIAGRLVDRRGWSLALSTPRGRDSWFFAMFRKGQTREDPDCESWTAPSWQNPHVDAEAIELERKRVPEAVFLQEYGAEFLGTHGSRICSLCGSPERRGPGCITLFEGEEVAECSECHNPVDENGAPLGWANDDGKVGLQIIRLAGMTRPKGWPMPEPPSPVPETPANIQSNVDQDTVKS
jgi:hypothetical protein